MAYLVLLQGFNPLPNYIASRYFLEHAQEVFDEPLNGIIIFYSEIDKSANTPSSKPYAENLKKAINMPSGKLPSKLISLCPLDSTNDAKKIQMNVSDTMKKLNLKPGTTKIHLNYTGGTKPMGVHAYSALEKWCEEAGKHFSASYLDDREFILSFEGMQKNGEIRKPTTKMREEVKIDDIQTLLVLHGYTKRDSHSRNEQIEQAALKSYRDDRDKYQNIVKDMRAFYDKAKSAGKEENSGMEASEKAKSVAAVLKRDLDELGILEYFPVISQDGEPFKKISKAECENFKTFEGYWFEDYVFDEMKKAANTNHVEWFTDNTVGVSLNAQKNSESQKNKSMEIDIFVLHGYQLIGISVTTAKIQSICKSKGFEIIYRTQQLGGDGRIALLVTLMPGDHIGDFEEDLKADGNISKRFKVFGSENFDTIGQDIMEALQCM